MRTLTLALTLTFAGSLHAADADFKAIVHGLESRLGVRQTHIPFLGLASFIVKVSRPAGVHQLDFAIFEDARFTAPDQETFDHIVRSATGERWRPFVIVRSRHDHESNYIYIREAGDNFKLLIATFEHDEATVVELKLDARALAEICDDPQHIEKILDR